jgi:hypothetical protein
MPRPSPSRAHRGADLAAALILAGGVALGFATAGLPRVTPATAPATSVSAQRALADLQVIAREPHPVGTVAHDRVRDYLVDRLRAVGCSDVHVQSAVGFDNLAGPLAATVANVVCRVRGTSPGHALLLTAHYDAVPRGLGAGDDGAGVVAILEVVRALRAAPPRSRDLMVVFTDAEEEGLLGAEAFVDLHPWAHDVSTVLNFDARGDAGPVYMFQTSPGNAGMIAALARVVNGRANSLTGEVYRHLPNDTDLSIWLHARPDVAGLNFADVDGYTRYHTPIDDVAHLDLRVVQQMADYALGLTGALDTATTPAARIGDAVYFNTPIVGLIRYPESWAVPLMLLTVVLLGMLVARRRRDLDLGAIAGGVAATLGLVILAVLTTWIGWRVVRLLHPGYRDILQGDPYNSRWYLLTDACLVAAGVVVFQRRARNHGTEVGLAVGAAVIWALVGIAVAVTLPGASYLIEWPLLGAIAAAAVWPRHSPVEMPGALVILLCAIPAVVLWPPLVRALEIGLTAAMLPACAAMIALVVLLLTLPLALTGSLQRSLAQLSAVAGLGALAVAELWSGFTVARPHPDSLILLHDVESERAWWVSFDAAPDAWTRPVLSEHPAPTDFSPYRLPGATHPLLAHAAVAPPVTDSPLRAVADSSTPQSRMLRLHLAREGEEESIALLVAGGTVKTMSINGRALTSANGGRYGAGYQMGDGGNALRYFGVPEEGLDLSMTISGHAPLTLELTTSLPGWPRQSTGPQPARPTGFISKPFVPTDVTITLRQVRIGN